MRYAVISDIHANLEALRAVLARIAELGADRIVCLGDVVGYNADPNACVEIVRSEGIACVLGNHDAAACGLTEPHNFNPAAREAAYWTRDTLTDESKAFLRGLPRHLIIGDMVLCHGSIGDTDRYLLDEQDMREIFAELAGLPGGLQICFYGHTHLMASHSLKGSTLARVLADRIDLAGGTMYSINPGGLGQPRDGDPDAPFLLYDTKERTATFHRVAYNVAATQAKILQAGLPARLALRLSMGR